MNDVAELKQFVTAHTRAQQLDPTRVADVLSRISHDEGDAVTPGSWVHAWSLEADDLERQGLLLEACRHYTIARFPYTDGPARGEAHRRAVAAFDHWRLAHPAVQRLDVAVPGGGTARCWAAGLDAPVPRPVLLFLGGIVTVKEQWAPALRQADALGVAMIVTEMPGVGENTAVYSRDSHRMFPAILDAVSDRADTAHTYAIAHSFSGHLALRWAADDPRARGIVTAGAPVADFFTDEVWWPHVPRITVDTLAALTGTTAAGVAAHIRDWALTDDELARIDVPVRYIASTRDEIIPASDVDRLRRCLSDLEVMENDDVHGSPDHAAQARLWTILSILRASGAPPARRALFATLLAATRLRDHLTRRAATPHEAAAPLRKETAS